MNFIDPIMQNTSAQQQMQKQIMGRGNDMMGMVNQLPAMDYLSSQGMNPLKMAEMLRKGNPMLNKQQGAEISALGSNPVNKLSGYNTGMFGWGNYGE